MFKGTNMMWKSIALVLVLCMSFSTMVALADDPVDGPEVPTGNAVAITTTKAEAEAEYNADGKVTIAGTFGNETCTDDVTILAVRDTAEQDLDVVGGKEGTTGAWDTDTLQKQVVYIDQIEAVAGTFSFTFIPRTGISGKTITVFVGGKDAEPVKLSFPAAPAAPTLVPLTWYKGEALKFALRKDDGTPWAAGAAAEWWAAVDATAGSDATADPAESDNMLIGGAVATFTAPVAEGDDQVISTTDATDGVTSVVIKDAAGITNYKDAKYEGAALTAVDKPKGEVGDLPETIVIGVPAEVEIDYANLDFAEDWFGALTAKTATVKIGDTPANYNYESGVFTITANEKASGKLTIAVTNYEVTESADAVSVITPAEADKAELDKGKAATDKPGEGEEAFYTGDPAYATASDLEKADRAMFGRKIVTLPATGTNGSVLTWKVSKDDGPAEEISDGDYELVRPASNDPEKKAVYTFTAIIGEESDGITASFSITVTKVGSALSVDASNVTLKAKDGAAYGISGAKVATIKLPVDMIDPETQTIKVGITEFYYAPERSNNEIDVFVAILRDTNTDEATVAEAAEFVEVASENKLKNYIYYGRVSYASSSAAMTGADAAAAKRLNKDKEIDTSNGKAWTDAQYLTFDVYGTAEITGAHAACIKRANKDQTKNEFIVITQ